MPVVWYCAALPLLRTSDLSASVRSPELDWKKVLVLKIADQSPPIGSLPLRLICDWLRLFGVMPVTEPMLSGCTIS